ncbi:hypothetical protein ACJZ2D_014559 [Fusarium nematophilum]
MVKSLFVASVLAAGVVAQSTPDAELDNFQHLGCVAIKPGTFPRERNLFWNSCIPTCTTNGDILAFHGSSCACDRLELSAEPIPYRVTKVDDSFCTQWCDPADRTRGTCGGAAVLGWPVYDLYKRNNARIIFEPFPSQEKRATPGPPGQTPVPVPNPSEPKPGDVWHDCPPGVVDCPNRKKCPGGNCPQPQPVPVPQPCHGCSHNGTTNWTAPGCPSGGCKPGTQPAPGGSGGQGGAGGQGGSGGSGGEGGAGGQGGQGGSGGSEGSGSSGGTGGDGGAGGQGGQGGAGGQGGEGGQGSAGGEGGAGGQGGTGGQESPGNPNETPAPANSAMKAQAGGFTIAAVAAVFGFSLL